MVSVWVREILNTHTPVYVHQPHAHMHASWCRFRWKVHEAAVYALGTVAYILVEEGLPAGFNIDHFVRDVLLSDVQNTNAGAGSDGGAGSFMKGRALWCASQLSALLPGDVMPAFVAAAAAGVRESEPTPVRFSACKAISEFFSRVEPNALGEVMGGVLSDLFGLLPQASVDTLHLVLHTIVSVLKVMKTDTAAMTLAEPTVTPLLINTLLWNSSDPFVAEGVIDVISVFAQTAACVPALCGTLVPIIVNVLKTSELPGQKEVRVGGYAYIYICVCVFIYIYICVCMHIYRYLYIYACACMYIMVCM